LQIKLGKSGNWKIYILEQKAKEVSHLMLSALLLEKVDFFIEN